MRSVMLASRRLVESVKPPVIGDIFEINTSRGNAYVQFTHDTDRGRFGEVLRVLDGIESERPHDFKGRPTKYFVLYPLKKLVRKRQGYVNWVTNEDVPLDARPFPLFRNGLPGPDGTIADWWLWDGKTETRVGRITAEQRRLPFFEVLNPEALKEAIESGWTPETDPRSG
jgi:hypothetical protein